VVVGLGLSELVALSGHVILGESWKIVWMSDFQGRNLWSLGVKVSRCSGVKASSPLPD
jgi:hypothetical protein